MKSYTKYRSENKLPGIHTVPEHWGVMRNSFIFREICETGYGHLELLSIVADKGIIKQSETGRKDRASEDRSKYKRIIKGDIGYNLMNAFSGSIGVSNYEGIISPAYAVCRPKFKISSNYFHYLFRTDLYLTEFDRYAYGIMYERNRLYFENFKQIYVPFPPLDEQHEIVHFIEHKILEIDHFINNKKRLVKLLKEQKSAIIDRAVTKGLNLSISMKSSGIKWLGDIPKDWNIVPLKHIAKIQTGVTLGKTYTNQPLKSLPYLRVANVQDGYLDISDIKTIDLPEGEIERYFLKKGDVLMTEGGDFDKLGRGYVWEGEIKDCLHQNHIFAVRPNAFYLKSYFLAALMKSFYGRRYFIITSKQTTNLASTNSTTLKNFKIILPKLEEQTKILQYIKEESRKIDLAISKAEKEIELIQEYRTTLISDAVTGKIDVREITPVV